LALHLAAKETEGHVLFIFDEPTTGLHFDDIAKLLQCFTALIEAGHSVLIIEHNIDVVKCADHVIDLGPEGGAEGGYVVAVGTPEEIARHASSYTGKFLKTALK
jgi:excinuclease ABC subunit A